MIRVIVKRQVYSRSNYLKLYSVKIDFNSFLKKQIYSRKKSVDNIFKNDII